MPDDTLLPFSLPAIKPKKVIAAFDGGRLSSNGGVALLALAEKRVGIIDRLARLFPDDRDQDRVTHPLDSILGARVFAIGCGYEDGNDLDHLRKDPAFKLACGRLPDSGLDLVLAADDLAPGECALSSGCRAADLCADRPVGCQLPTAA